MKIFSAIFVSAIVAITIGRCRAEFLLVQVDDATGKGPRSNNTAKAREIEELARQGICDIKPCCCDSCYPCDYEKIFGTKKLAEAKFNEKLQDPRGPSSCGIRGCGPPPCPTPCSRSARSNATSRALPTLSCLPSSQYKCSPNLEWEEDEATGDWVVQCPNTEEPEELGNFMQYQITATSMSLDGVCMTNCGEPRPKQCHCSTMLDKVLDRHTNVNEITGTFASANFIGGCRCYLGAAARAEFKFVQMDEPGFLRRCEERKEISKNKLSPNYYVKVCDTLFRQGCEDKDGRITKA